jgi:hypothetical protein
MQRASMADVRFSQILTVYGVDLRENRVAQFRICSNAMDSLQIYASSPACHLGIFGLQKRKLVAYRDQCMSTILATSSP